MLKNCILFLFIWVSAFSQAQENYYNKTIDIDNVHNGFSGINHFNSDTVLIDGFLQDQPYKRYRTFSFINAINGDTITSFQYGRDTIDIYGGTANDMCIVGNEIFACGAYYKQGKTYANILKFSLNGELLLDSLYFKELEWTEFDCMLSTDDGNFFIVGSKETVSGDLDGWLIKMDSNGNIFWEKTFDYSSYDGAILIAPYQNKFLISAGKSDLITGKLDLWLLLVDSLGEIVWEKTYGGPYYDGGAARPLSNGEIHVSGYRKYEINKNEAFIMRLNNNGDLIWEKSIFKMTTMNAPSDLSHFVELADASILVGGTTYENDSPLDYPVARIYKMNQNGDSLWTRILKLRNNDNYLTDIKELENGDLLISGFVFPDSPNNTEDGWIMRTNCLGYFEHPKDSIVLSGSGENVLSLTNYSSYYDYTIVDWGDNSSDTMYASGNQNIMHEYTLPGNYSINTTTIACNDTIHKNSEYLVIPEQYESSDLVIFPNPNQGQFEIWLDSPELYSLEIMDLNGRIVKSALNVKMNQGYIIDLSELGSSIYLVRAFSGNKSFHKRVVTIDY